MKKILSVFCTIVIVCAIFGGCTTSSEETAVTNNDLYNYDFPLQRLRDVGIGKM